MRVLDTINLSPLRRDRLYWGKNLKKKNNPWHTNFGERIIGQITQYCYNLYQVDGRY